MTRRRCGNEEDFKKTKANRKINAPKQLPRNRPRRLTDPPLHPPRSWKDVTLRHIPQQIFDQPASLLFARLPVEVRQLIWTNVLGGNLLHVARARKRLLVLACVGAADSKRATQKHNCRYYCGGWPDFPRTHIPGLYVGPVDDSAARPAKLLPLLQSCRKAYVESISILYQDNIFDLNHLDTLFYLQRSVLPQRLAEIHSLNLSWNFPYTISASSVPYNLATWVRACSVLASLPGLQTLRVRLTGVDRGEDRKNQWEPVLEAMKEIKSGREFEVFLPWSGAECESAARSVMYPFKLMSTK